MDAQRGALVHAQVAVQVVVMQDAKDPVRVDALVAKDALVVPELVNRIALVDALTDVMVTVVRHVLRDAPMHALVVIRNALDVMVHVVVHVMRRALSHVVHRVMMGALVHV